MRHNGYELTPYVATRELENGDTFELKWVDATSEGTHDDPPESLDDDYHFYINGKEVDEDDLPEEITNDVLDELKESAEYDPSWTFGPD